MIQFDYINYISSQIKKNDLTELLNREDHD